MSDYKDGFGGKFGVQSDRQDKSALGWDHQEEKQKHDSQKGGGRDELKSLAAFYIVFVLVQITRRGLEVNLVSRVTEWTRVLWGGSIMRRWINTSPRKVIKL